jgi:hypothetical protein
VTVKSNYIGNKSDQRKLALEVAKEEIERQKKDFCPKCQQRMEMQTIAVMCKALNVLYGFGKERLKKLIESSEGIGTMMHDTNSDYEKAVEWLRDAMGIDLNEP